MPEPVFYMRGFPGPHAYYPPASAEVVDDLKDVARLRDEQVTDLRKRLERAEGFLDPATLLATIREVVPDKEISGAIRNAIRNLNPARVNSMLADLEQEKDEEGFPFDAETFARLESVLPALIQPCTALTRFKKAERLAKITGQPLEGVELICDLRPIFDEERKRIEGMMPYTQLRVIATGGDGLPRTFEAQLTHQQVHDLAEKAEKAKRKLETLYESVENWLPEKLPDLPLTRLPRRNTNDA